MINIKKFTFNEFSENTYVIWDEKSKEGLIVDPGCSNQQEEIILTNFISQKNLSIKYLINTHCHLDHIMGCKFIKEKFNPVYLIPEKDLPFLEHIDQQFSFLGVEIEKPPMPDKFITGELVLNIGDAIPKFLFTPGHTPGEYCIYFEKEKFCITGDVLFQENIGRTDLWGGDYDTLLNSIKQELFTLPDDTVIYPGHGENSEIGYEKRNNPFIIQSV
jgi:glyoxylase-like metal-dependent hydrolase (beta-lactamase superfamily II)